MSFLTQVLTDDLLAGHETPHNAVMAMFPRDLPGGAAERRAVSNILFITVGDMTIIRSDIEPTRGAPSRRTIPARATPPAGTVVRFQTVVNAIHRGKSSGSTPVADIDTWIESKLAGALEQVTVLEHHRNVADSGRSPLSMDTIHGQAVVANEAALTSLMREGVGRAKAYGCGMLLVVG